MEVIDIEEVSVRFCRHPFTIENRVIKWQCQDERLKRLGVVMGMECTCPKGVWNVWSSEGVVVRLKVLPCVADH